MELLQIKMLNTAVERILNQEMSELGLTYTQTTVIGYLIENQNKEICQKDIEYSLGLTHPTVSSILRRMEKNGMIDIQVLPTDHRYKRIALTDKAIAQSKQIAIKYKKVKERLFQNIRPEERQILNETIQNMMKNLQ